jgi:hypothetical protein
VNIIRGLQWWCWYRWSKVSRSEREQIRIIRNTELLTTAHKAEMRDWFAACVEADRHKARSTTEAK